MTGSGRRRPPVWPRAVAALTAIVVVTVVLFPAYGVTCYADAAGTDPCSGSPAISLIGATLPSSALLLWSVLSVVLAVVAWLGVHVAQAQRSRPGRETA